MKKIFFLLFNGLGLTDCVPFFSILVRLRTRSMPRGIGRGRRGRR